MIASRNELILFLVSLGSAVVLCAAAAALYLIVANAPLVVIWSLLVLLASGVSLWFIYRFAFRDEDVG